MKIKWLGHSCFLLTSDSGTRVLTDPFDSRVGYKLPSVEADIVTISHGHGDHNYVQAVRGKFVQISQAGTFEHHGIRMTGIPVFHDEVNGSKRGKNIIYLFDIDGIGICHCGDLGHIPSQAQLDEIGKVDFLLLPVGGTYTVDYAEAWKIVQLIKPRVTIPMHFQAGIVNFPLDRVDKFLAEAGAGGRKDIFAGKQELEVTPDKLAALPEILVLDYES